MVARPMQCDAMLCYAMLCHDMLGFAGSNFDNCAWSGRAASAKLRECLQGGASAL